MLEWIPSPPQVLALKMSDRISGTDLDPLMDRFDAALAQPGKVHLFLETHHIAALEFRGFAQYLGRAMPLMGKLERFGRIAIVADQAWIRLATRLESAVLPHIRYRVCKPEDRDEALAWVLGADAAG